MRADLLVLPHHGAYHEGLEEFLDLVAPQVAVASGPEPDVSPRTRLLLRDRGVPLFITGQDGAVTVTLRGRNARVRCSSSDREVQFPVRRRRWPAPPSASPPPGDGTEP